MAPRIRQRSFISAALLVLAILGTGLIVLTDGRSTDGAWIVEDVDGRPYLAARRAVVRFEDGAVIATAGCNQLNAEFRPRSGALTWAEDYSQTIKACSPPQVMDQEALVFDRLIRARRVEGPTKDRLLLTAADGHSIRLRRQQP